MSFSMSCGLNEASKQIRLSDLKFTEDEPEVAPLPQKINESKQAPLSPAPKQFPSKTSMQNILNGKKINDSSPRFMQRDGWDVSEYMANKPTLSRESKTMPMQESVCKKPSKWQSFKSLFTRPSTKPVGYACSTEDFFAPSAKANQQESASVGRKWSFFKLSTWFAKANQA